MKKILVGILIVGVLAPAAVFAATQAECTTAGLSFNPAGAGGAGDCIYTQAFCTARGLGYDSTAAGGVGDCSSTGGFTRSPATDNPNGTVVLGNITYVPLEPIPGIPLNGRMQFGVLLQTLFKVLIGIGALITIGAFIYAGIAYMTSDVIGTKTDAKKRLWAAILGLFILIAAWLILYTINPQLVRFSNVLDPAPNGTFIPTPANQIPGTATAACVADYIGSDIAACKPTCTAVRDATGITACLQN